MDGAEPYWKPELAGEVSRPLILAAGAGATGEAVMPWTSYRPGAMQSRIPGALILVTVTAAPVNADAASGACQVSGMVESLVWSTSDDVPQLAAARGIIAERVGSPMGYAWSGLIPLTLARQGAALCLTLTAAAPGFAAPAEFQALLSWAFVPTLTMAPR